MKVSLCNRGLVFVRVDIEGSWIKFENSDNKKHSENADTSTSVTFALQLWPGHWPDLKAVYRLTSRLPTWVEQSMDTYSWSTSSFPTIIYPGWIISFLYLSFKFFLVGHMSRLASKYKQI